MIRRLLALALLSAAPAGAQVLAGRLTDARSGEPLRAAAVSLEADGTIERSAVTGADGGFELIAPRAGRWVLRVRRLGFRDYRSESIDLAAGERREMALAVAGDPIAIEGITARGEPRCEMPAGGGDGLATVWEEVRKALFLTAHTAADSAFAYEYVSFQRRLDAEGREVLWDSVGTDTIRGGVPFASLPADSLARIGFVRPVLPHVVFYAPDAEVLLSQRFLETHCFRLEPAGRADEPLLGLSFEPLRGHTLPDVRGTLWVERATLGLRRIDFRYTGIRGWGGAVLGGSMEFAQLPTGGWIVRSWRLAWPEGPIRFGRTAADLRFMRHHAIREVGGSVVGLLP